MKKQNLASRFGHDCSVVRTKCTQNQLQIYCRFQNINLRLDVIVWATRGMKRGMSGEVCVCADGGGGSCDENNKDMSRFCCEDIKELILASRYEHNCSVVRTIKWSLFTEPSGLLACVLSFSLSWCCCFLLCSQLPCLLGWRLILCCHREQLKYRHGDPLRGRRYLHFSWSQWSVLSPFQLIKVIDVISILTDKSDRRYLHFNW